MKPRPSTVGFRLGRFAWAVVLLALVGPHAVAAKPKGLPKQLDRAYDAVKAHALANKVEIKGIKFIDEDFLMLVEYLNSAEYQKSKLMLLNRTTEAKLFQSQDEEQKLLDEPHWLAALWLEWRHHKRVNEGESIKRPSRNRPFRWSGVECTLAA